MTIQERQQIGKLVRQILWMARRYADKRSTSAPSTFNDVYDQLRDIFGDIIDREDSTLDYSPYVVTSEFSLDNKIDELSIESIKKRKYYLKK